MSNSKIAALRALKALLMAQIRQRDYLTTSEVEELESALQGICKALHVLEAYR